MPSIIFVGTGEAFDADSPCTSILYRGSRTVLFDCGYAVPHALWRLTRDAELLDAVYVSHPHADHCFGLPALLAWMCSCGRTRPLNLLGGPGTSSWLPRLLELGYPGTFASDRCYTINPVEVHPGASMGYGALTLRTAQSEHGVANFAVRVEEGPTALCFSGDGAPTAATRELYRGATVLVHECFGRLPGTSGHAHFAEVIDVAVEADADTLCIVHVAIEARTDVQRDASTVGAPPRIVLPAPGDSLVL